MARKNKKEAYVVFRGRIPGLYRTWDECSAQVLGFSKGYQLGYERFEEAEKAWAEHTARQDAEKPIRVFVAGRLEGKPIKEEVMDSDYDSDREELEKPRNLKRPTDCSDLDDYQYQAAEKRQRISRNESDDEWEAITQDPGVELTVEQEEVVSLAMRGHNMFLTGAGGSGKTVTLKEILRCLKTRKKKYQVVAPTGIAALPLGGKTIHSFMGWKPDTLRKSLDDILNDMKPYIRKGIRKAQVLIVEEISMVENQNLERMNLILQDVMTNSSPFGGKQVIFLGDFHQLPPVKPFEFCLHCGSMMTKVDHGECTFVCDEDGCTNRGLAFREGSKWAFQAPVWKRLNLRHIQLQRIHRQKDKQFKDILTNIRHGISLTLEEWDSLERIKPPPLHGIYPVRLMSRRRQVAEINRAELQAIKLPSKSWTAVNRYEKKYPFPKWNHSRPWESDQPLKNHRLPECLVLKVGAKVVLLHNFNQQRGLVNGSQGVVVGFQKMDGVDCDPEIKFIEGKPKIGPGNTKRHWDTFSAPVVRFANGIIMPVFAIDSTSQYGTKKMPYLATRVQIPLTLAWALTIHKSQGMTLDYIEVSSRNIFETGQFYVALSRGTNIEGVTVTGFSRDQLPLDDDVVDFYQGTKWETFGTAEPKDNDDVIVNLKEETPSDGEAVGWIVDLKPGSPEKKAVLEWQKSLLTSPYI
ncbi:ATP-dependent DNA helicase PIF1 [Drepanopeziza brunnea f. sp. 'multigermtubi' MB_m1]|uniref:ATP-dependent DNA helicase n=1 Tax=Marssonina brunnea f. sp. multigermtubi (strain MB_m1) TaxID=1072389 RepID=K1XHV2_MARBU|nr:ATP-dependent DNA helicase PIF1 [Drepanopeziza brunnea f. sp. 'multigermtubi' MB_m1]EKD20343.1 ATP-dependent DNA helicase PIF1 [Drepanopeziza brunnea f. sp. 'multigermtubi' MB_m1]